jgi:hypothetical protein
MKNLMIEERFNFLNKETKDFIVAFDHEMSTLGYDFGQSIGKGYCWGRFMIIYSKTNVKNKKVTARIYIREDGSIVLRLFFNQIDKHREYIENAPAYIKEVFTGDHGRCGHCGNDKDGQCKFRKTYTLDNRLIEKCNGVTFEFGYPTLEKLPDYISLFKEFYPQRKISAAEAV